MTSRISTFVVAALLGLSTTSAWAAGNVTGVSLNKASIVIGDSMLATVSGTIMKDFFGRGCMVRVSLKYSNNVVEVVHPSFAVDAFPSSGFYLKPTKAGTVTVIADGGTQSFLGWPPCTGKAQKSIKVKLKLVPLSPVQRKKK